MYNPGDFEKKWQDKWQKDGTNRAENNSEKPPFYVLDMFPYPSGAGLHVGHPLGYIASDIYARYKRHNGFNVLHPMGYDSFGLPAEQYAIQTGQHPEKTTAENLKRYREQLDKIGFSFDWSREVRTSDPKFYRWTQWIFIQLFHHWFDNVQDKARPIVELEAHFAEHGSANLDAACSEGLDFSAEGWRAYDAHQRAEILLRYRLAYRSESVVNWCPALGTVLANDEVKDGFSERGGHPVEQKKMMQWSLRISAYADRLLRDLETLQWSESIKEAQRNWIGKSQGAAVFFPVKDSNKTIEVFTTRPDTLYGVTFMVLAPEHEWVQELTTEDYREKVNAYREKAARKSERDRMMETKTVSGQFTGGYAMHPLSGEAIPVYIADYVLAGYGTGAIMAVPAHDSRDHAFAKHFDLPIREVVKAPSDWDIQAESFDGKEGKIINSEFLNGLEVKAAIVRAIEEVETKKLGFGKTNYRLRDAIFGRQRYWGEPIPVYYDNGIPKTIDEKHLPLNLPEVDKFLPTEDGEPPLARAEKWNYDPAKGEVVANGQGHPIETTTMPGWAGSSWYYLRYMDPHNEEAPFSKEAVEYWREVDLYMGGSEHATGHLLYARFWHKFLHDLGMVPTNEPFRKMVNQGMIQGNAAFVYRLQMLSVAVESKSGELDINLLHDKGSPDGKSFIISHELAQKIESKNQDFDLIEYLSKKGHHFKRKKTSSGNVFEFFPKLQRVYANISDVDANNIISTNALSKEKEIASYDTLLPNESGAFLCTREVGKMSKRWKNVVNPDEIVEKYGADTLRMYEMFLGPLEQSKPWNTEGISGVANFLKKLWKLYINKEGQLQLIDEPASAEMRKSLHKTIKKVREDIEAFSFNTGVSAFMICVNELSAAQCRHKEILEPLLILLSPYAPHIAEELWSKMGNMKSITKKRYPEFNPEFLVESTVVYPVSFNGKKRYEIEVPKDMSKEEVEKTALSHESAARYLEGKTPKKVIVVLGRIVNVVM
ncbi:MAG: leucine--tRNA ligase [Cryomorphaceae bacterium]|nr:leucine--tRNA ligase [Cryomorphaceae bacterium]